MHQSWKEQLLDDLMCIVAIPVVCTLLMCLWLWQAIFGDDNG